MDQPKIAPIGLNRFVRVGQGPIPNDQQRRFNKRGLVSNVSEDEPKSPWLRFGLVSGTPNDLEGVSAWVVSRFSTSNGLLPL